MFWVVERKQKYKLYLRSICTVSIKPTIDTIWLPWASLVAQRVKNPPAMWGDLGSIPRLGRFPGEGNGYSLQYSGLEFHGQRSLAGYSPWGRKDLNMTERLSLPDLLKPPPMMLWVTSLLGLIPSPFSHCVYLLIMCLLTIHFCVYFAYNTLLNYLISQDFNWSVLKMRYLFCFWLCQASVVAYQAFAVASRVLSCSTWDLLPWPGLNPGPLHLEHEALTHWTTKGVSQN